MNKEIRVLLGVGVLMIVGAVILFKFKGSPAFNPPADPGKLVRAENHMTGSKDAKVILVEFGDFQCPFCATAAPAVKQIREEYKANSDFSFVFRNFPLPQHQYAKLTAQAAEAAGAQGKYWEMLDVIYEKQNEWVGSSNTLETLVKYATDLGLDVPKFRDDVTHNRYTQQIETDLTDAGAIGVNSTPTFYLNGEKLNTTSDYNTLKQKIDEALKK